MAADPLDRVKRAAARKARAEQEYRSALAAVPAGQYGLLAGLLGVSRQAARQAVERARKTP